MKIPTHKLSNGMSIPMIGIGTWELTGNQCTESIKIALALGYRHIDTAEMYTNEEQIGKAIAGFPRDQLFITSKVWPGNASYAGMMKACDKSLEKLGTNYLDLYLLHWPKKELDLKEAFRGFADLIKQGKIRAMGVSNFTITQLKDAIALAGEAGIQIVTNQVEFHPMLHQKELLDFCKANKIAVTAYSPLARGMVLKNNVITNVAAKYSKTAAQVSLAWLVQKDIIVIPKASSESHMAQNLELPHLEQADMKRIDEITDRQRMVNPAWAVWD